LPGVSDSGFLKKDNPLKILYKNLIYAIKVQGKQPEITERLALYDPR
jgi:hypothetical protein